MNSDYGMVMHVCVGAAWFFREDTGKYNARAGVFAGRDLHFWEF